MKLCLKISIVPELNLTKPHRETDQTRSVNSEEITVHPDTVGMPVPCKKRDDGGTLFHSFQQPICTVEGSLSLFMAWECPRMDKQQHRVPFVIRFFRFLTEGIVEGIGPNAAAVFDWIALVIDVGEREAKAWGGINDLKRFGNVEPFRKCFKRPLLCVGVVIAGDTV